MELSTPFIFFLFPLRCRNKIKSFIKEEEHFAPFEIKVHCVRPTLVFHSSSEVVYFELLNAVKKLSSLLLDNLENVMCI